MLRCVSGAIAFVLVLGTTTASTAAAVVPRTLPEPAHVAGDDLDDALQRGELTPAEYALERALSIYRLKEIRGRYGHVAAPDPRSATVLLRDLALHMSGLSGNDRMLARRILALPTSEEARPEFGGFNADATQRFMCSTNMCFHWEEGTANSPPAADANGDTIPDWVQTTSEVFEHVWSIEVGQYGYRPPKPDVGAPDTPDSRLDIFLTDTGGAATPFYGACGVNDPNFQDPAYQFSDFAAVCQVDNDFSLQQFPAPAANGLEALQVTAAHEFFHAIQFGYDALEDVWLLEGTAVWMEDQVYDEVNDNYQYLLSSAIVAPFASLDRSGTEFLFEYASWLFWRFLSEHFGANGVDPSVIKRVWDLADGSAVGPDQYSLQAVQSVVGDLGSSFGDVFADFALANYLPELFYEEGDAYVDAVGFAPESSNKITASKRKVGGTISMDHLTSYYASFLPGKGILSTAKLKLVLDLPGPITGPQATALVAFKTGTIQEIALVLDSSGAVTRKLTFNKKKVTGIILILSNASTRFNCGQGTSYSCAGVPTDDGLSYKVTATLIQ